jgi:polar amino acid transport system permease protein
LKTTSLAVVVGGAVYELFTVGNQISTYNTEVIPLLFVVSIWYLAMTSVLTFAQYYIERYYARGSQRQLPPTPLQRFRRLLFNWHGGMPLEHGRDVVAVQRNDSGIR